VADANSFEVIETEWVTMADGVRLAARIWLPAEARQKPVPAILEYLPYRRRDATAARDETSYPAFARAGYAGVRLDRRGTGDSDGIYDDEYSPEELDDAVQTIAWISAQPWCSGTVGMMGISWGGFNALQTAALRPPALKATISIASTVDRYATDIHYKGGCLLSAQIYWANVVLYETARAPDAAVRPDWRPLWLERLARIDPPAFLWTRHQRRDPIWRHGSICEDYAAVAAPSLVIAGFADGYRSTPAEAVKGLTNGSKAMTGPWVHLYPHIAWPKPRADFFGEALAWWDRWLKEQPEADLPDHRVYRQEGLRPKPGPVRIAGQWLAIDDIAAPVKERRLYLHDGGALADVSGAPAEVSLATEQDVGASNGEFFTRDPAVDIHGDQAEDDARSLCFETEVLAEPLDVIGRPSLSLPVAVDRQQANLVARLVDVHPDGTATLIALGILNLSHRESSEAPQPMVPGAVEQVTLLLDETAYRFLPGHRLRLALSTAWFPLIMPPPEPVTATLSLGKDASLSLPHPATVREIDVAEPPEDFAAVKHPTEGKTVWNRRVGRDAESGRTTTLIETDTGTITHPENGMVWRETRLGRWSILPEDPLSLEGYEEAWALRRRDDVKTEVYGLTTLKASKTHWLVACTLEAKEDGQVVFQKRWSEAIPRDCV